ncbi:MAG: hypothetical protein ACPHK8_05720, partial [Thermoplasmatota archaeon]
MDAWLAQEQRQRWVHERKLLLPRLEEARAAKEYMASEVAFEQHDVEALEGGLRAWFLSRRGKLEEAKAQEFTELCKARSRLHDRTRIVERLERRLRELDEGIASIPEAPVPAPRPELAAADLEFVDIEEARMAAMEAKGFAATVEYWLQNAAEWGVADMLIGGVLVSAVKYDRIRRAQRHLAELQDALRALDKELQDLGPLLERPGMTAMQAIDIFFDGLFVDWIVQSEIRGNQQKIQTLQSDLDKLLVSLDER